MPEPRDLKGIFLPLTTPFESSGRLSAARLRANVEKYNRTRVAGYVATGSTGEAILLTRAETEELWGAVAEAAAPDKILVAGTGAESTAETIDLTRRAAAMGYGFALVRTPHYYRPQMTPDVLAQFYLRLADASPIPLLIYSIPQFTGITVEAPLVLRLAEHPNIAGMKDSSGSVQRVGEIAGAAPASFRMLVGSASTVFPSLMVGAHGAILALADALPEACVELYESAVAGRIDEARNLQQKLIPASITLVSRCGAAGTKYALDKLGYYGGPVREPLQAPNAAACAAIEGVLAELGAMAAAGD